MDTHGRDGGHTCDRFGHASLLHLVSQLGAFGVEPAHERRRVPHRMSLDCHHSVCECLSSESADGNEAQTSRACQRQQSDAKMKVQ